MNETNKIDLHKAKAWLSGEVEIRMPKAWLILGGLAVVALLFLALD